MTKIWLLELLLLLSVPLACSAQNFAAENDPKPATDCSNERFEQAEHWNTATFSDSRVREKRIAEIARECPNEPWSAQVSEFLKATREESAEHSFLVAKYYQDLSKSAYGMGLKGARARYREIVERFPDYSKLDLTLLNLGDVETALGNHDDAWTSYQQLINEFPTSQLVGTAFKQLQRLEKMRIHSPISVSGQTP